MNIDHLLLPLLIIANTVLVLLLAFSKGYIQRKGENLATKQDIRELTDKIESVRHEYAQQLESARAVFSSRLHVYQVRYQKEYEILVELADKLVELRDAAQALRPVLDYYDESKSEDERKKERLKRYSDALRSLYLTYEKKRPFYPEELYKTIHEFHRATWKEAVEYSIMRKKDADYWDKSLKNADEISKSADDTLDAIRKRITEWEAIDLKLIESQCTDTA